MSGYTGTYHYSLDHKGRLAIPAKFRKIIRPAGSRGKSGKNGPKGSLMLTVGFDGCLAIYPPLEWNRIEEKLGTLSFTHRAYRFVNRLLHGRACDVVCDAQGRITIPQEWLAAAGIKKEVVIIGASRWFEVWEPQRYEQYVAGFGQTFEEVAEKLFDDREK